MGGAASSLAVRVRCGRGGAGGAPGTVRGGRLSKSVAKALCDRIDREQNRGISTILLARPGPMGAFATDLDKPRRRGPRGRGAADRVPFSRRVTPGRVGLFPARAAVLHIGEGRPRVQIPDFPRDSGTLPRTSVSGGCPPMCRTSPSAHGRISTVLNVGRFPHDSADPPTVDSGRMCNTASVSPIPHIRARCAGDSVRAETGRAGSGLRNASPARRNPPRLAPCELSATESACARFLRARLAQCDLR